MAERDDIEAVRRFLREELAAERGDLWEVVLSERIRARAGRGTEPSGDPAAGPGSGGGPAHGGMPGNDPTARAAPAPARAVPPAAPEPPSDLLFDTAPLAATAGPGEARAGDTLEVVAGEVRGCTKCGLHECRTQAVPGVGTGSSGIVFVGEAPGAEEDRRGEPFVGRAGELLTRILAAMDERGLIPNVKIDRGTVFICNVLKCRPPENRNPLPHEIESCSPYLYRQLALLRPKIICCLGRFAAELLVGAKGSVGSMRGKTYRYGPSKLIVTYHPAACLRNPNLKRPVWDDMQRLAAEYLAP